MLFPKVQALLLLRSRSTNLFPETHFILCPFFDIVAYCKNPPQGTPFSPPLNLNSNFLTFAEVVIQPVPHPFFL